MSASYTSLNPLGTAAISRKREIMAACALLISILGFVSQTEILGYLSDQGYQKPMTVMYITHSCMAFLFPFQILALWLAKCFQRGNDWSSFYSKHRAQLKHIAITVTELNGYSPADLKYYIIKISAILAISLNLAGASWYLAVNMTTTSDLTAIFNCSTFFAYGFSVLLLKEKLNIGKLSSVILSIIGVVIIAYLGSMGSNAGVDKDTTSRRTLGNIIIAVGTILYGLYEVLYKKIACPPQKVSAKKQAIFANFIGATIGVATFALMWPVLIILHFTGAETFEIPSFTVIKFLLLSIVGNVAFSGAFLVLMSLTSPVLGSVSSLLATCTVPVVNFLIWGETINLAEILGGLLIVAAFGLMTWASADDFIEDDNDSD